MPIIDQLTASAAHHTEHTPHLAAVVASDAAYLLAHAADPTVEHALQWRVPRILAALDHAPSDVLDSVFAKAKRAAGTPALPGPVQRAPARVSGQSSSWLTIDPLRDLLGDAVHTSLQLAEIRYTGREDPNAPWTPGTMPLPAALHGVSAEACRLTSLDPVWVPVIDVQVAHAIARANELPHGAGPLDDRIPAYMAHVVRLEPITQADTLSVAITDFISCHPRADADRSDRASSARTQAARTANGHLAVGHTPSAAPDAVGSGIAAQSRRAVR